MEGGIYQDEKLNKRADKLTNYEKVIPIVKKCEKVIRSQNKSILTVASRQSGACKVFKNSDKFLEMVKELGVSKSAIYFKTNLIKILGKYLKQKKKIVVVKIIFLNDYTKALK